VTELQIYSPLPNPR